MTQPSDPKLQAVPGKKRRRRRRKARSEGQPTRGISLLPQALTTGNLAAGFYAIIEAGAGSPERASYAIFVAGMFDMLDGRAARMTGSTSRFGAEYDSIADTVSFGVAPAVIAFYAGGLVHLGWEGWVAAFVYAACAGLRLARFNISQGRYQGRFDGIPSPMAAGTVVSTVWFGGHLDQIGQTWQLPPSLAAMGLIGVGLLMVSPIPYRSFKDLDFRGNYRTIVAMLLLFIALLAKPRVSFFTVAVLYIASGPFEWWWRSRTGGTLTPLASDGGGEESRPGPKPLRRPEEPDAPLDL